MNNKNFFNLSNNQFQKLDNYLRKLYSTLSIGEDGKKIYINLQNYNNYLRIILDIIYNETISPRILRSIINTIINNENRFFKNLNGEEFLKEVSSRAIFYVEKEPSDFIILFPFNAHIRNISSKLDMKIGNHLLQLTHWAELSKYLELDNFFSESDLYVKNMKSQLFYINFTPIVITISARDYFEAFYTAIESIHFFRSYINFIDQFGHTFQRWGGVSIQIGKYLPPPTYGVFDQSGKYRTLFYTNCKYSNYKSNIIATQDFEIILKNLKKYEDFGDESSSKNILISAIKKYGNALDAIEEQLIFLTFWQILELLSLRPKDHHSMEKTIARCKLLLNNNEDLIDLLQVLQSSRNLFVHEGSFPENYGFDEIMFLKQVVDEAILKFSYLIESYKTKTEIELFYKFSSENNFNLKMIHKITKNLLNERGINT